MANALDPQGTDKPAFHVLPLDPSPHPPLRSPPSRLPSSISDRAPPLPPSDKQSPTNSTRIRNHFPVLRLWSWELPSPFSPPSCARHSSRPKSEACCLLGQSHVPSRTCATLTGPAGACSVSLVAARALGMTGPFLIVLSIEVGPFTRQVHQDSTLRARVPGQQASLTVAYFSPHPKQVCPRLSQIQRQTYRLAESG